MGKKNPLKQLEKGIKDTLKSGEKAVKDVLRAGEDVVKAPFEASQEVYNELAKLGKDTIDAFTPDELQEVLRDLEDYVAHGGLEKDIKYGISDDLKDIEDTFAHGGLEEDIKEGMKDVEDSLIHGGLEDKINEELKNVEDSLIHGGIEEDAKDFLKDFGKPFEDAIKSVGEAGDSILDVGGEVIDVIQLPTETAIEGLKDIKDFFEPDEEEVDSGDSGLDMDNEADRIKKIQADREAMIKGLNKPKRIDRTRIGLDEISSFGRGTY